MTISEIAAKAGVSAATVSRVLNGKGHVKDSTRQQILHVIRQNEYVPSEIARGLSKSDSNNIGVFVTDIENPFFSKAVRGIAEKADLYGYNVVLFNTDEDPEKEHRYLQTVLGLRIKGLIIAPVFETDDETRLRLQRMQERGGGLAAGKKRLVRRHGRCVAAAAGAGAAVHRLADGPFHLRRLFQRRRGGVKIDHRTTSTGASPGAAC